MLFSVVSTKGGADGTLIAIWRSLHDFRGAGGADSHRAGPVGGLGRRALPVRPRRLRRGRVCFPGDAGRERLPVSRGTTIRRSIGSNFTTCRRPGRIAPIATPRRSWKRRRRKGSAYSCEALYLDPGWDTDFGTFLWGEKWLGPRRQFLQEMQSKYGLKVSLHCPLATWVSHQYSWGLGAVKTWPEAAMRRGSGEPADESRTACGCRRCGKAGATWRCCPAAKAHASSVYAKGANAHPPDRPSQRRLVRQQRQLDCRRKCPPGPRLISAACIRLVKCALGNDHLQQYTDRAATELRILVATNYNADSQASSWREVARHAGEALQTEQRFPFAPTPARWVRVELLKGGHDMPRLDEIEIYEAEPAGPAEAKAFAQDARCGPKPPPAKQMLGPLICLGSKQYRNEAAKRLLANCADGAAFLMFDGNWWNGGCMDTEPRPSGSVSSRKTTSAPTSTWLSASMPSTRRCSIEMHDPIAGGSPARITARLLQVWLAGQLRRELGFRADVGSAGGPEQGRARCSLLLQPGLQCAHLPPHRSAQGQRELRGVVVVCLDLPASGHRRHQPQTGRGCTRRSRP